MNIEYDKIIEKAEVRRKALHEITGFVIAHTEEARQAVDTLIDFNSLLADLYGKIDEEGRALLPGQLRTYCAYSTGTNALKGMRTGGNSHNGLNGLTMLVRGSV